MLTVTDEAKKQLKQIMDARNLGPGKFLRLAVPPVWTGPGEWGIVIADAGAGDHVVSYQGRSVLLIDPGLAEQMASAVLDFKQDTPHGPAFTLDVY